MSVIAVFNQKGGVGKTTTCLNIAAALAQLRLRPCAIDLDPQAHLSLAMGAGNVGGSDSAFAFFRGDKSLATLARAQPSGVRLIPASGDMAKIDALHAGDANIASCLKRGLAGDFAQDGAPVLIDCCPTLGVLTLNALVAADKVLIPVSSDYLSLQSVHKLDAALGALEQRLGKTFDRRVLLTRFNTRRKLSFTVFDELHRRYGRALCATRIGENVSLAESPAQHKDIFAYAPASSGSTDYRALTRELGMSGFFQ
jgi:chromosome partitioning protein